MSLSNHEMAQRLAEREGEVSDGTAAIVYALLAVADALNAPQVRTQTVTVEAVRELSPTIAEAVRRATGATS